ncbi:2-hydroxyacid dehydrogenase [Demequina activiva]|uniref:Dehydrogenase n=1 Tax=Demequina activiva TaxID=1582364 RepID=A0A919UHA8_9MICO|nr:2-hydroxyacid dehydrogenase [Demequina activiva]GIG55209.1 dehydrogenase [Demequina activiva]
MITVAVPHQKIADALGEVGDDARVIVWDPSAGPIPDEERERVTIACIPHLSGGREVYQRLAECPDLRVIQIPSAGYEHAVPLVPAGKKLANARGVHDSRTAEMALTLALASQRRLPKFLDAQRRETWDADPYAPSLADRRCLVVGYGSIGSALGARLRASEATVTGVARTARTAPDGTDVRAIEDLPALLPDTEIVFLVTPLTEQTEGLVDAMFLAALPDDALVVNVGRGKVVDTDALLAELQTGRLRAALDVTDPEPLPDGHPLWSAPGCIVVPHVAGFALLTDKRYIALLRRQIEAARHGDDPVNFVAMGAFPA